MAKPLNKKMHKAIEDYEAGATLAEVSKKYRLDKGYLSRYFKNNGITNGRIPQFITSKTTKDSNRAIKDIVDIRRNADINKSIQSSLNSTLEELRSEEEPQEERIDDTIEYKTTKLQDLLNEKRAQAEAEEKEASESFDADEPTTQSTTIETQIVKSEADISSSVDKIDHMDDIREINAEIMALIKKRNPHFAKGFQTIAAMLIQKASSILQGDKVTTSDLNNIARTISLLNETLAVFPKVPSIAQQININQNERKTNQSGKNTLKDFNLSIELVEAKPREQNE